MRAVVLQRYGSPKEALTLTEHPSPRAQAGEVIIRSEGFGVNYADIMARKGLYQAAPKPPCVLGYEVVGQVEHTGSETDASLIGQRVLAFTRFGAYGEMVTASQKAIVPISKDISAVEALSLCTQFSTAYYAMYMLARPRPDELVLVHAAAGGVGQALIQLAQLNHCRIIALTGSTRKADFVQERYQPWMLINYRNNNYRDELLKALGKPGIDVVFNSLGGRSFRDDLSLLDTGGRLILYGAASRSDMGKGMWATLKLLWQMGLIIPVQLMMRSITVSGLNMLKVGDDRPEQLKPILTELLNLYQQGLIQPVVDRVYSVDEIAEAHLRMESRESMGKIVVLWDQL